MRLIRLILGAACLGAVASTWAYVGPPGAVGVAADLPEPLQARVANAAKALGADRKPGAIQSANGLAIECLTLAELFGRGDKSFESALRRSSRDLARKVIDGERKPAWGREAADEKSPKCPNGGYDHFGDGTCDPSGTGYAFQSGLATACIVRAGKLLDDAELAALGRRALAYWAVRSSEPRQCNGCRHFWASDVEADRGRFVRNTTQYLALAYALADGGRGAVPPLVKQTLRSEAWERQRGNRGYLSALDPMWTKKASEADRIENHTGGVAALLHGIAVWTGSDDAADLALWNYNTWANCDNDRCVKGDCKYWSGDVQRCAATVTYVHCTFRNVSTAARARCLTLLERGDPISANALLFILAGDKGGARN